MNTPPLPPERGPKLFFTSAKTGEGVRDVFEYIARRVVLKWEYDEWAEARIMHFRDASGAHASAVAETIRLQRDQRPRKAMVECCKS
jgi:Ras-related protein Rab-7A